MAEYKYEVIGARGAVYHTSTLAEARKVAGKRGKIRRNPSTKPFGVGESLYLLAPDGLSVDVVNYRGKIGDKATVVLGGMQLTIPVSRLSREKPKKKRNPSKRATLLEAASQLSGYMNCKLFAQTLLDCPKLDKQPRESYRGQPLATGDTLAWGDGLHYAVWVGDGEVVEVEEWGAEPRVVKLADLVEAIDPPDVVYKTSKPKKKKRNPLSSRIAGVVKQYGPVVAWLTLDVLVGYREGDDNRPSMDYAYPGGITLLKKKAAELFGRKAGASSREPWDAGMRWYFDEALRGDAYWFWRGDPNMREFDAVVPWVALQVNRALKGKLAETWQRRKPRWESGGFPPDNRLSPLVTLSQEIPEIRDWVAATSPNLMSLSISQVDHKVEEWHLEMAQAARDAELCETAGPPVPGKVVLEFDDGWTVQELETPEQIKYEGNAMGHCVGVGGYVQRVAAGEIRIFSLRDPQSRSHATIEVVLRTGQDPDSPYVAQVKGKGNEYIEDAKMCEHIYAWLAETGFAQATNDLGECKKRNPTEPIYTDYMNREERFNEWVESQGLKIGRHQGGPSDYFLVQVPMPHRWRGWEPVHGAAQVGVRISDHAQRSRSRVGSWRDIDIDVNIAPRATTYEQGKKKIIALLKERLREAMEDEPEDFDEAEREAAHKWLKKRNPVRKVKGGWQWGRSGKVYKRKADADAQARAIYASGYDD